jgi:hypothetical protein
MFSNVMWATAVAALTSTSARVDDARAGKYLLCRVPEAGCAQKTCARGHLRLSVGNPTDELWCVRGNTKIKDLTPPLREAFLRFIREKRESLRKR